MARWTRIIAAILLGLPASQVLADPDYGEGRLRMRAREHYEQIGVYTSAGAATYRGFTNTIDVVYEKPFAYAIGIAGSPLFAGLHADKAPTGYSSFIRIIYLGAEAKVFPMPSLTHVYTRFGWFNTTLSSYSSAGTLSGASELAALGYEFDLGGIGLAPEMAWRWAQLSHGTRASGSAPSLGLHFYKML